MKKLSKFFLAVTVLFMAVTMCKTNAFAAEDLTGLAAVHNGTSVTVTGTVTNGSVEAVSVMIFDSLDNLIGIQSVAPNASDAFSVVFTDISFTTGEVYTVKAANFDGGDYSTTTFTTIAPLPPAPPVQNETTQNQSTKSRATSGESVWITGILKSTYAGSQSQYRSQIAVQGPECRKIFAQVTPAGYTEAFSFNLFVNNQVSYDTKTGKYVLFIPKEFQKAGRVFKLITIDKLGQTTILSDEDNSDETITINNLNYAGYAFSLIYTDTDSVLNSGSYVVKRGDTLSKIAKKLGKTMDYLILQNGILNPNKIFKNQIIKY